MARRCEISVAASDSRIMQMKNRNTSSKGLDAIGSEERILGHPGPRTPQGKRRARYNALKHGILSNAVLEDRESKAEYDRLLKGFIDYFQPEGALEEMLVEKLATLFWRYRRLLRSETVEIADSLELNAQGEMILTSWNTDEFIRYEVNLERAIDRTLAQLERLQRRRLGQPLLPPVKVELSA